MERRSVILIPAYDPPKNFCSYIQELMDEGFRDIIIVDDGSRQEKSDLFSKAGEMGCTVFHHQSNRGKGMALKTGMREYLETYSGKRDGLITVNSDGCDRISDIIKISEELDKQNDRLKPKLVLGTRSFDSPYMSNATRKGSRIAVLWFHYLFNARCSDVLCTLRGIPDRLVKVCMKYSERSYAYETSYLIGMKDYGYSEVPIELTEPNPDAETHFNLVWNTILIYVVIFRKLMVFGATSIFAACIDIFLFWIFTAFLLKNVPYPIIVSTFLARSVSATFNYFLSRALVFKSNESRRKSLRQFMALTAVQCSISAFTVHFLEMLIGGGAVRLKVAVDLALFFAAYKIQDKFIFKTK